LSPIQSAADAGELGSNGILPDVESLRIPVQYLANLLTAGDTQPVLLALKRMLAMRHYKRAETVDGKVDTRALEEGAERSAGAGDVSLSGDCELRRSFRGTEQPSRTGA
jgi:nitrate reductase beta subunit